MSNPYAPPQPGQPPADGAPTPGAPAGGGTGTSRAPGSAEVPPSAPHGTSPGLVPPRPFPAGPDRLPPGGSVPPPGVRPPLPPADPAVVLRAGRLIRHFGVYLLAAIAVSALPLPWQAAGLAFAVGALVTGIRALRAVGQARLGGGVLPMLVAGLVMTSLLTLAMLWSLTGWTAESQRQDCLRSALTQSARLACEQQYREDRMPQLDGSAVGSQG